MYSCSIWHTKRFRCRNTNGCRLIPDSSNASSRVSQRARRYHPSRAESSSASASPITRRSSTKFTSSPGNSPTPRRSRRWIHASARSTAARSASTEPTSRPQRCSCRSQSSSTIRRNSTPASGADAACIDAGIPIGSKLAMASNSWADRLFVVRMCSGGVCPDANGLPRTGKPEINVPFSSMDKQAQTSALCRHTKTSRQN